MFWKAPAADGLLRALAAFAEQMMLVMSQQPMTIWSLASLNLCARHTVAGGTSPCPHRCVVTACWKALYKAAYSIYKPSTILKSKTWPGPKTIDIFLKICKKLAENSNKKYQQQAVAEQTWWPALHSQNPYRGGKREAAPHNCSLTSTHHDHQSTRTIINKILNRCLEDKKQSSNIVYWH